MYKHLIFGMSFFLLVGFANAQQGSVRGTVIDKTTGEPLIGVSVAVKETSQGAVTDFDGKFEIKLDPGVYDITLSYISYQSITVEKINVEPNKANFIGEVSLAEDDTELGAVTVTAETIRNTEQAILSVKMKSPAVMDGISAASFRKIGDSDAAGAAKRVTGVSVEGGKYVFVRGLGDRYTKTMLNNVDIPGLDPDRNSLQIDIFPTSLLNNMIVVKSFMAEYPAEFTGGLVNIETLDFPDFKTLDISVGIGFNPNMHFNSNFLGAPNTEGSTDFLGFDDGNRQLPSQAKSSNIPSPLNSSTNDQQVNSFLNDFTPSFSPEEQTSFMDFNFGISYANQVTLKNENNIGFILSGAYKSQTTFYDDVIYGEYQRFSDPNEFELRYATIQNGSLSIRNVLLGGMGGLAYKTDKAKYRITLMHLQNGEMKAGSFDIINDGEAVGQSGYEGYADNLEYNQRGLTNLLLNGVHYNEDATWTIDWRVSPTISTLRDPDVRKAGFSENENGIIVNAGEVGFPNRIWRNLDEINVVGKVDLSRDYSLFNRKAKLKFGASHVYKQRDYEILIFDVNFFGSQPNFSGDPNEFFADNNLYPNNSVYLQSQNNNPNPNAYESSVNNSAFYISNEFSPLSKLRTIIGLRVENYIQNHTGRDQNAAQSITDAVSRGATEEEAIQQVKDNPGLGRVLDNDEVLNSLDLFPSVNLIYEVTTSQNLRASYSRTIARPSFKELSFAQILDPITNRIFNGGLFQYDDWDGNLTETRIDNFDLRWEWFFNAGQMVSVSGFYKRFDDPIELVRIPEQQTSTEFQPRNVGDGLVYGVELEARKNLAFIAPAVRHFNLNGNVTLVESQIEMTDREFNARKTFERNGESIKNTRRMAGQAPFMINFGLSYNNINSGTDIGLYYNVKGSTLYIVGSGLYPDIYAEPFESLNLTANQTIGKDKRTSISFKVTNLLNDVREEVYRSFEAEDQYFTRFSPWREFSIGVKYSFF